MEEEYHESDVVFSEICQLPSTLRASAPNKTTLDKRSTKKPRIHTSITKSLPLDIPVHNPVRYVELLEYKNKNNDDDDEDYEDLEMKRLPPHLIIARRINSMNTQIACSYCLEDGNGRILKGRNLFQVRNSILRLTGFIET